MHESSEGALFDRACELLFLCAEGRHLDVEELDLCTAGLRAFFRPGLGAVVALEAHAYVHVRIAAG